MWIGPSHESWIENGKPVHRDIPGHFSEGHPSMPKPRTRRKATRGRSSLNTELRLEMKRALEKQVRVEKGVQRLTRLLDREMQRTNDRIQALAAVLGSRARAIETERDVDRSLAGAGPGK